MADDTIEKEYCAGYLVIVLLGNVIEHSSNKKFDPNRWSGNIHITKSKFDENRDEKGCHLPRNRIKRKSKIN